MSILIEVKMCLLSIRSLGRMITLAARRIQGHLGTNRLRQDTGVCCNVPIVHHALIHI
jgi:hypothetical protein